MNLLIPIPPSFDAGVASPHVCIAQPHGMYWGAPPDDASPHLYPSGQRWDEVASRVGSTLHQRCSRWLIFVEGVDHCKQASHVRGCGQWDYPKLPKSDPRCTCTFPSAAGQSPDTVVPSSWWGENLQGVPRSPIQIRASDGHSVKGKVVLSPHTYGPSVYAQPYFADATFPANLPAIWDAQYGRLNTEHAYAIVIGEWGGRFTGQDAIWQHAFASYLATRHFGSFYWCACTRPGLHVPIAAPPFPAYAQHQAHICAPQCCAACTCAKRPRTSGAPRKHLDRPCLCSKQECQP